MNPILQNFLYTLAMQIAGFILLYFWKKNQETPEKLIEKLEAAIEKRLDHTEAETKDRENSLWDVIDSLRKEHMNARGDIMWIKAKINGHQWKQDP